MKHSLIPVFFVQSAYLCAPGDEADASCHLTHWSCTAWGRSRHGDYRWDWRRRDFCRGRTGDRQFKHCGVRQWLLGRSIGDRGGLWPRQLHRRIVGPQEAWLKRRGADDGPLLHHVDIWDGRYARMQYSRWDFVQCPSIRTGVSHYVHICRWTPCYNVGGGARITPCSVPCGSERTPALSARTVEHTTSIVYEDMLLIPNRCAEERLKPCVKDKVWSFWWAML